MRDQLASAAERLRRSKPRRPASFWFTILACALYAVLFVFSTYVVGRHFGVRKDPGWTAAPTAEG